MIRYRKKWPDGADDLAVELTMFRNWTPSKPQEHPRFYHLRKAIALMRPDIQWHSWLEDQLEALCGEDSAVRSGPSVFRNVVFGGCAAAGKTYSAGLYSWVWWLADMDNSVVILTSTKKGMVRRRVWPVMQDMFARTRQTLAERTGANPDDVYAGHIVDSELMIQAHRGDHKHSISGIAVRDGETQKAVANIKGQHVPRILVVIDEATDCPEAIYEAIPNLRKACQDVTVLSIANTTSRLNPHGVLSEPLDGWPNVNRSMHRWKTKGCDKWQIPPGLFLRFSGAQSPNVTAKRTIFPFLYTWEDYLASTKRDQTTIGYWAEDAGWWPPDGIVNTVLTETMLERHDAYGQHRFLPESTIPCAGLDPAFGGDNCVFTHGLIGTLESGGLALQINGWKNIPVSEGVEADFSIATWCIEQCKALGVAPSMFGMDSTAIGRGVAAIIANEWSSDIRRVEFGGAPSELPSGEEDHRPGKEVFDRRVTELWFSVRELITTGRLKGIDRETAKEFCTRQYDKPARKYCLETKTDFKAHWGYSPDRADSVVVLVEVAKLNGLRPTTSLAKRRNSAWQSLVETTQAVYQDIDYSPA